jgi:hypothetical protein
MARYNRRKVMEWIQEDYRSHPMRFIAEITGMISNLLASTILMWYSPHPPMFAAYIFFLIASALLMTCALSRKSVGISLMYLLYLGIDGVGFLKTLL